MTVSEYYCFLGIVNDGHPIQVIDVDGVVYCFFVGDSHDGRMGYFGVLYVQ